MKHLLLERVEHALHAKQAEGFLSFGNEILATIERPWIVDPAGRPGGKSEVSCVPAGIYKLRQHTRPDGKWSLALTNPDLGVYYLAGDRPKEYGRFLILIHIGNWVSDVIGCIAPGLTKGDSSKGRMVMNSTKAMARLEDFIAGDEVELEIRWL